MPAEYSAIMLQKHFEAINDRLRGIENQVKLLSDKAGIPYELPSAGVPQEVVELAEAGKTLEAIKKYRELTEADFETAREVVSGL